MELFFSKSMSALDGDNLQEATGHQVSPSITLKKWYSQAILPKWNTSALKLICNCNQKEETKQQSSSAITKQSSSSSDIPTNEEFIKFLAPHIDLCKKVALKLKSDFSLPKTIDFIPKSLKPVIIFDLDDTLITVINGVFVARPFVNYIIESIADIYEIWIWTASEMAHANQAIEVLGILPKVQRILCRDACTRVGDFYIKDLSIIPNLDLKQTIIIDNLIASFIKQLTNGIVVSSFNGDCLDKELFELTQLILCLKDASDMRNVIKELFNYQDFLNN